MRIDLLQSFSLQNWGSSLWVGLLASALILAGCDSNGGMDDNDMPDNPTVTELASNQENLNTLASALQQAELDEDLNSEDATFTVFAPVDDAFANIDADELTNDPELLSEVLEYHVVPGQAIEASDIQDGQTVETLEGETLQFSVGGNSVQVNDASVTQADVQASNGVVHVIDGVLLETVDAVNRATLTPELSTTADAIEAAGLDGSDSPLRSETLTIFAPTDGAYDGLKVDALTNNPELLGSILDYHVVPGSRIPSDQISGGETPGTREGGALNIEVNNGTVTVNGIPVSTTDIETENATIHLIDGVLLQRIDIVERTLITEGLETLTSAVQAAGLDASDSRLRDDNPVTVFAPMNGAFDPLDIDELTGDAEILNRVLTHHVLSSEITSNDLSGGEMPTTLEGGTLEIEVTDGTVTVNDIPVTTTDIETRNGIVHLLDGVLLERLDVVQRATVTSNLSTLTTAVGAANLANTLKGEGPFTVFAPADDGFANYNLDALTGNQDLLTRVLTYHVIGGQELTSGDLSSGESPQTEEGGTISIDVGDAVTLNGRVSVTGTDVQVRNGVLHLLDDVLLRRTNAVQRALVTPNFSILADLVAQAGLDDDLSQEDAALTVFAPTDDAFLAALDNNDNEEIDEGEVPSNAADLLKYHVGDGVFYTADAPTDPSGMMIPDGDTDVATLEGSNILVRRDGSSVTLNPENEASSVVAPDVDVTNGVIHGVDTVLSIPSSN